MTPAMIFGLARGGVNIFSSVVGGLAASDIAETRADIAETVEEMRRARLKYRSSLVASERTEEMLDLISSQRAALGASGVGGGRTARLLEATARRQRSVQRQAAQTSLQSAFINSRTRGELAGIRAEATQARAIGNMLGTVSSTVLSLGMLYQRNQEQTQAIEGNDQTNLPEPPEVTRTGSAMSLFGLDSPSTWDWRAFKQRR